MRIPLQHKRAVALLSMLAPLAAIAGQTYTDEPAKAA